MMVTRSIRSNGAMPPNVVVAAGAVLVMLLWAVCFPLIRIGLNASPPMWFAALRALIAGIALLLVARTARRRPIRGARDWSAIVLVGLTATSLGFFGMFYGATLVSPGLATVVANTQPLLAAPVAVAVLGESLRFAQWLGLLTGFVGIVLIGAPGIAVPDQTMGVLYVLVGAVGVAIGNVLLKGLAQRVDVFWAMGWQLAIGSLPLMLLGMALEDARAIGWDTTFVASLLLLSIFGTSAAFALWFLLLRRCMLNQLNVFSFLTPIFGLALGVLFFNETLSLTTTLGVVLGVISVVVVNRGPAPAGTGRAT